MDSDHSSLFNKKIRMGVLNNSYLNNLHWDEENAQSYTGYSKFYYSKVKPEINPSDNTLEYFHPMWLNSKANNEDNPLWAEATTGPNSKGFWDAMDTELATLERKDAWDKVDRTTDMNVLDSIWAFKIKRFPDGTLRKLKARFCVKGFQQIEGVDYFETYAPVVFWIMVRIMLVLSLILHLNT